MSAGARLRQGLRALAAWTKAVDYDLAARYLAPPLMELFRKMRRSEQLHSLNVLRMVRADGHTAASLMVAALLHDVGKCRAPFPLWERTIVVLTRAVAPHLARRWGFAHPDPVGWRRPFIISYQHPRWSAEMVVNAGGDPIAVAIIAAHQDRLDHPPRTEMERALAALQAADDAN